MFNVKFSLFLGIYTGPLSCIVKLPDELYASQTKRVGDVLRSAAHLVYPFKNILYNHLTGSVGKRHIAKGWSKAEISKLVQGKTTLSPEDPFENIEATLI